MSYTNKIGQNPLKLSNDIEIRSGTSATAEAISDHYRDVLEYEPGTGTMYISTSGQIFIHWKAGTDANTWALITDVPQPDLETHAINLSLAASSPKFSINKSLGAEITLTPSITRDLIISPKEAEITLAIGSPVIIRTLGARKVNIGLSPSIIKSVKPVKGAEITLSDSVNKWL